MLKKEYSYTATTPMGLSGLFQGETLVYFTSNSLVSLFFCGEFEHANHQPTSVAHNLVQALNLS